MAPHGVELSVTDTILWKTESSQNHNVFFPPSAPPQWLRRPKSKCPTLGELWWQGWRRWPRRRWKERGTLLQPPAWSRRIRWPNRCVHSAFSRRGEPWAASLSGGGRWSAVFRVCQCYEHRMLCVALNKEQRTCVLFRTCILGDLHDLGPWARLGTGLSILTSLCKFGSRLEVRCSGDSELSSRWLGAVVGSLYSWMGRQLFFQRTQGWKAAR